MSNPFTSLVLALALVLPLSAVPDRAPRAPQRPVNLNTASVTELMQLPRIGQKTAERIIAFRKQHGGFQRPEELMNVKGIGEKSYAKLKPFLAATTSAPRPAALKK
jgi:competence protein ComEA